jgi:hypothetical protein
VVFYTNPAATGTARPPAILRFRGSQLPVPHRVNPCQQSPGRYPQVIPNPRLPVPRRPSRPRPKPSPRPRPRDPPKPEHRPAQVGVKYPHLPVVLPAPRALRERLDIRRASYWPTHGAARPVVAVHLRDDTTPRSRARSSASSCPPSARQWCPSSPLPRSTVFVRDFTACRRTNAVARGS